jgi:catechol 2,3-dioxygenase-like lactoylglutathione lyase family enzyme
MPVKINGMMPLLSVFRMPRSLAFYRDVLGFEVVADSGDGDDSSWVWVRLNGCDLMLNDQYEPGSGPEAPPTDRQKWHHDTCLYFGADPDGVHEYLRVNGIYVKPPKDAPYGMRQLYLHDPDGYNLCFQAPVK